MDNNSIAHPHWSSVLDKGSHRCTEQKVCIDGADTKETESKLAPKGNRVVLEWYRSLLQASIAGESSGRQ